MPKASHQDLRFAFRELLASGSCYHTASVFDPMSARIAADLGFEVGILGGSVATSASACKRRSTSPCSASLNHSPHGW